MASNSVEDPALYTFIEQVVADHMTREAKTASQALTLRELGDLFEKDDFNAYPVEDGSQVIGLVSKFDFLPRFVFTPANMVPRYDDLMNQTVSAIMTPDFIYLRPRGHQADAGASANGQSPYPKHACDRRVSAARRHNFARRCDAGSAAQRWRESLVSPNHRQITRALRPCDLARSQSAFNKWSSSDDFRHTPDIVSTQHRWS